MVAVVACDIHLECCEGTLNDGWKIDKPVSFHRFREKLAKQQLRCDPRDRKYAGDEFFRVSTQQPIRRRSPSRSPTRSTDASVATTGSSSVTSEQLKNADSRLCGDLTKFIHHGNSIRKIQKRAHRVCAVCGKPAYHICTLCKDNKHKDGVPLHKPPTSPDEPTCYYQCQNTLFHGLAKADTRMTGTKRKDYAYPTADAIAEHGDTIKRLKEQQQPVLQPTRGVDNDENVEIVAVTNNVFVRNGNEHGRL